MQWAQLANDKISTRIFFSETDSKWVVGKNWNLDDRAVGYTIYTKSHKIQNVKFLILHTMYVVLVLAI